MQHYLLFAADEPFPFWSLIPAAVALVFFSFLLMLMNRYKRCRSDQVLVIFGKVGGGSLCFHVWAGRLAAGVENARPQDWEGPGVSGNALR